MTRSFAADDRLRAVLGSYRSLFDLAARSRDVLTIVGDPDGINAFLPRQRLRGRLCGLGRSSGSECDREPSLQHLKPTP
jgi:hypothetical protein